jgi:hypothetical protein
MAGFRRSFLLPAAAMLSASLAACSIENRARDDHALVALGMTSEEVREAIGDPADVRRCDPGGDLLWQYIYSSSDGYGLQIFRDFVVVVGSVGTVAALLLGRGGGWSDYTCSNSWRPAPAASQSWRFSLRFAPDGRVVEISELR